MVTQAFGEHVEPVDDVDPAAIEAYASKLAERLDTTRVEIRDRYWEGQTLEIDGYRFVNCKFENCQLVFRWPNFELTDCVLVATDVLPKWKADRETSAEPTKDT